MSVRTLAVTLGVTVTLTSPAFAQTGERPRSIRYGHTDGAIAYLRTRMKAERDGISVGRNLVTDGVRFKWVSKTGQRKHWGIRRASWVELRREIFRLRAASVPATPPTYTSVSRATTRSVAESAPASGLASCIVQRESGGNAQAVNPNGHYGIAQWDQATWEAQGGTRYAATPLGASREQQMAVLNQALANGQSGAWTPYDGC